MKEKTVGVLLFFPFLSLSWTHEDGAFGVRSSKCDEDAPETTEAIVVRDAVLFLRASERVAVPKQRNITQRQTKKKKKKKKKKKDEIKTFLFGSTRKAFL